jgi:hypothetical protein
VPKKPRLASEPGPDSVSAPDASTAPVSMQLLSGSAAETAIHAMLDDHRNWKRRDQRAPIYGDDNGTYVTVGNPLTILDNSQETFAWNKVLALDDATAQTFLYVMARCLAENDAPGTVRRVRIHTNDLLAFRGIKRHHAGDFRPQQKIEERDRLLALSQMWVVGRDTVLEKRGNKIRKKKLRLYSHLIELTIETEDETSTSLTLPELELPAGLIPYGFRVALGEWAQSYVGAGYMRALLNRIVQYDPKLTVERIAMRVGLYLHFKPLVHPTVAELLDGAKIEIPRLNPERFRDAFEEALDRLATDGILRTWSYRDSAAKLPRYKWFDHWLTWEIKIQAPPVPLKASEISVTPPIARSKKTF